MSDPTKVQCINTRNGYVDVVKVPKQGWHATNFPYVRLGFFRTKAKLKEAIEQN